MTLRPTVLVCEDSDEDFDTLTDAARTAGLAADIRRATTGDGCLALLRGTGDDKVSPLVVLLDLNLPGLDGREALTEIRADPALRALPIVIITTSANPRDVAFCFETGANAYHVKPVRYPDHLQVIRDVFDYWLRKVLLPATGKGNP